MAKSKRELENEVRARYTQLIMQALINAGEDVAPIGNGIVNGPTVDSEGNELYFEIYVKIPHGARIPKEDGGGNEQYDCEDLREVYQEKLALAKEKAAAKAKKEKAKAKSQD